MSPYLVIFIIAAYFLVLITISYFTSRNADNEAFFLGNRKSPWYIVAFGMIGASLSGVTFISVPGWVDTNHFTYMPFVFGFIFGYAFIYSVLIPTYYKLNLTSIYTYLEHRFGIFSYKTGSVFFLISRVTGASLRLFLVANVLQITIFKYWNIPFYITVIITIALIWLYTFRGGIKTIIWTDTLQTLFMLFAVIITVILISKELNLNFSALVSTVKNSEYYNFFETDWLKKNHYIKQFISGIFIPIVMTGMDQDMMQKNLSCRNIKEAKKNMFWFSLILIPVNFIFLCLGVLLYIYAAKNNIPFPQSSDDLYPILATKYLPPVVGIFFILGLIAAAYSSADSALTSLTTSFSVDILNIKKTNKSKKEKKKIRIIVHIGVSILLIIVILIFKLINNRSIIDAVYAIAGYTYGPLLGLFFFGLFTKYKVKEKFVPVVAILSPVLCYIMSLYSKEFLNGYEIGYELLLLNGLLTFLGLLIFREKKTSRK